MQDTILNNGVRMPMQGFGLFQVTDESVCKAAVLSAISAGYRLIDTASVYGNERATGEAVRESGVSRSDIFLTTKAWITEMGYDQTMHAFESSLKRLGTDYVDLYLIHMPFGDYHGAWRAMEAIYKSKRARAIGVCNFEPDRLMDLCLSSEIIPAVDQVELHPFTQQTKSLQFMRKMKIQAEAWGPLAEGANGLFSHPVLKAIGDKYGKTAVQVVLRWHLQRGVIAIPKSVHDSRIRENFNINDFKLDDRDMAAITALDMGKSLILDLHSTEEVDRMYHIEFNN